MIELWVYKVEKSIMGATIDDVPILYRDRVAERLGIELEEQK